MNDISEFALNALQQATFRGTAIILLAWGIVHLIQKMSHAHKHALFTISLSSLVALPLLYALATPFKLAVLPAQEPALVPVKSQDIIVDTGDNLSLPTAVVTSPQKQTADLSLKEILLYVWFSVTCLTALYYAWGSCVVRTIVSRKKQVTENDSELFRIWKKLLKENAVKRSVHLYLSQEDHIPFTYGLFAPKIIIPRNYSQWDQHDLEMILLHELGHVVRYDAFGQCILKAVQILYWFNPLVWLIERSFNLLREKACDDWVITKSSRPKQYSETLLSFVRGLHAYNAIPPKYLSMAQTSNLEGRLLSILNPKVNRNTMNTKSFALIFILMALIITPISLIQLEAKTVEIRASKASSSQGDISKILETTIIPEINFEGVRLKQGLKTLSNEIKRLNSGKQEITIRVILTTNERMPILSMSISETTVEGVLNFISSATGYSWTSFEGEIIFFPKGQETVIKQALTGAQKRSQEKVQVIPRRTLMAAHAQTVKAQSQREQERSLEKQKETREAYKAMEAIIIPEIDFDGVPLTEVMETLFVLAEKHDPKKAGFSILAIIPKGEVAPNVSISLRYMSLNRIIDFITKSVGYTWKVEDGVILIEETNTQTLEAHNQREQKRFLEKQKQAMEVRKAMEATVIPRVDFDGVPLTEVMKTLSVLAKEHDPKKAGFNILALLPKEKGTPKVTMSLRGLSLDRIMNFITKSVGRTWKIENGAILIE